MEEDKLSHLKELAHGAGISFLFGIFGYIVMFFFRLIAARYYGPSDLGMFSLSETILGLCALVAGLGINAGVSRYFPIYKHLGNEKLLLGYKNFAFKIQILSSFVISALVFVFSDKITLFFNFPLKFSLFLQVIAFVIPLRVIGDLLRSFFIAEKRVFYYNFSYYIIERLVLIIGILILWFFRLDIIYMVLLLLLSVLLAFVFDLFIYELKIKVNKSEKANYMIKEWIYFSFPLLFTGLFTFLISWTDNLTIGKFLAPKFLGVYSIAYSFAVSLGFFQASFAGIFMPLIAENYAKSDHNQISFLFKKSAAWIFGLTFPFFLVMFIFSKQILTLIYGRAFLTGYLPLMILSVGLMINITAGLNANILTLHKKTKQIFYVNLFVSLANLALNIILIQLIGLVGAAASSCFSLAIQNLIFFFIAKKYEKLNFDWIYNIKFIAAGIPSILIAASLFRLGLNILVALILSITVYALLYIFFLLIFKTFKEEDFQIMLAIEKRLGINLSILKKLVIKFY